MLPTEPPLSLHRLVAPVPPARTQETATAARRTPAPAPASNAAVARAERALPVGPALMAGHDQAGNAAVAKAATQAMPGTPRPVVIVPRAATPGR
ncbi:hypothetical protein GCM10017673_12490 [Streptosporangium violaceochromogenes]|nr:hypothetical protein GCM10017673_12490 [Streptosporangium violaceochromogenes]